VKPKRQAGGHVIPLLHFGESIRSAQWFCRNQPVLR
jgi:hypothetical protein